MDGSKEAAAPPLLMVVRRGDEERYQLLKQMFQSQRVNVVLDRRTGDRRGPGRTSEGGSNRRNGERRVPLPDTWVNLGFFVARSQVRHS